MGERNYTQAIDVWGVGCIVAELFVGRPILQGGKPGCVDDNENDLDQYLEICKVIHQLLSSRKHNFVVSDKRIFFFFLIKMSLSS